MKLFKKLVEKPKPLINFLGWLTLTIVNLLRIIDLIDFNSYIDFSILAIVLILTAKKDI